MGGFIVALHDKDSDSSQIKAYIGSRQWHSSIKEIKHLIWKIYSLHVCLIWYSSVSYLKKYECFQSCYWKGQGKSTDIGYYLWNKMKQYRLGWFLFIYKLSFEDRNTISDKHNFPHKAIWKSVITCEVNHSYIIDGACKKHIPSPLMKHNINYKKIINKLLSSYKHKFHYWYQEHFDKEHWDTFICIFSMCMSQLDQVMAWCNKLIQGTFWVWAQPMRGGVTM